MCVELVPGATSLVGACIHVFVHF